MKKIANALLYLYFFLLAFDNWGYFNTDFSKIIFGVFFICALPSVKINNNNELYVLIKCILSFNLLLFATSLFFSSDRYPFFMKYQYWLYPFICFFIVQYINGDIKIIKKTITAFMLGCTSLGGLFLLGYGIDLNNEEGITRVYLFGEDPNFMGCRLSFALSIAMYLYTITQKYVNKLFILVCTIPIIILAVSTASRTAIIAILMMFLIFIIYSRVTFTKKVILVACIGMIFFGIIMPLEQFEFLRDRFLSSITNKELSGRDIIWKGNLEIINEYPFFGVGTTGYNEKMTIILGKAMSSHNAILQIATYTGIFGVIIYSIFWKELYMRAYKTYKYSKCILPLLLCVTITLMIIGLHVLVTSYIWAMYSIILAMYIHSKRNLESSKDEFLSKREGALG